MAYFAVTSLKETLHLHFLQPQPRLPLQDKHEIVSLDKNLGFLQKILEKSEITYGYDHSAMKDLEAQIRDVVFIAEERIEMELSSIYLAKGWTNDLHIKASLLRLHGIFNQAVKQTDYLNKELIKISEKQLANGPSQDERTSSQPDPERENNITVSKFSKNASKCDNRMVGCHKEFKMILDKLSQQSAKQLQVVSIIGMGGIGKTTLAGEVYKDPSITSHFYKQAWVIVSQEYTIEQMLRGIIGCVSASSSDDEQSSNDPNQLAESLQKSLKGQRYLIVIDDIWSSNAWDSMKMCFPDDNNGSRILLTTRQREVAEYTATSGNSIINMPFLDANESWDLYCNVFGQTEFVLEFEQIGRQIVKKCKGLPLAITLVASLLSKTEERVETWKNVEKSVIGDSNEACLKVLYLSYTQLPHHLKACFLYFGVFPADYEIHVNKLVRLWAAEGFLMVEDHRKNMEEVAMECLQDLVDRSLVLVGKQSYNGKIKTIRIHDYLRDLCLREAQSENLLNVTAGLVKLPFFKRKLQNSFSKACPWISIRRGYLNVQIRSKCFDKFHSLHSVDYVDFSIKVLCHFKLLRVLDMILRCRNFENKELYIGNLVHLRYFALSLIQKVGHLELKHFEHWNMQSFIVRGCGVILESSEDSSKKFEILKMPLLRNFYVDGIPFTLKAPEVDHKNIQTISWLHTECCTEDLLKRIPNLKKLGIQAKMWFENENSDYFCNLVHLEHLEKLSIKEWSLKLPYSGIQWATSFLPNLKKLKFILTSFPWSDIRLIGMLPNLKVLKLIDACVGKEWEPCEGGFRQLKRLVVSSVCFEDWKAEGDHFPVLEHLELIGCTWLRKIPIEFADITTLALIQLNRCSDSVLASANRIQDEQQSYGNEALLVRYKNIRRP